MAAIATLAALGVAACGNDDDTGASSAEVGANTDAPAADIVIAGGDSEEAPAANAGDAQPEQPATAPRTGGSSVVLPEGRDLIIEMGMTLATSNVDRTDQDVRRLAEANGGWIAGSDVTIGDRLEDGSVDGGGTIDIRIAPAQLNTLIDDLRGVARVTRQEQATEDATAQLVDLGIRIRQARTGIAQIEVLYTQATEFADLVEIEQELSKRQIALEQLLAAQAGIEGRVAESRLTITIAYAPIPTDSELSEQEAPASADDGIADAFRSGWDAFAGAMFAVGFVLAVAAPFLLLGLVVLLVAWLVTRRRTGQRRLPAPVPTPTRPVESAKSDELVGASHED